ncbi:ferroptosis suppressor protein 1-like [Ciona intestinalis]
MGNGNSTQVAYQDNMHVVIVGGGQSGCYLAVQLLKSNFCKVTLIDPRDAMYHNHGAMRAAVNEDFMNYMFLPFADMLGSSFQRGTVVAMDSNNNTLTLKSGYQVRYTHLVVATGEDMPFPFKLGGENAELSAAKAADLLNQYRLELSDCNRIAFIGGGYNSVEMAGEIKTAFPDKEVIIITDEDHLVTKRARPALQASLLNILQQKGIAVIHNDSVYNLESVLTNRRADGQVLKTKNGKVLVTDFLINTEGAQINNGFYEKDLAGSMSPNGTLDVDDYLRVKGHDNIYAVGDVTSVDEEKTPCTPNEHAKVVKANLIAECNNATMTAYKAVMEVVLVSVGSEAGVSQICGMQFGNFPTKMAKGKDRNSSSTWTDLGLQLPAIKPEVCQGSKV